MASGGWWLLLAWAAVGPGAGASDMPHWLSIMPGFYVAWDFDTDSQNITFYVEAAAMGWVGIGFTPSGGMDRADMMTAWIRDGKPYFHDRFGVGNNEPVIDASQDCTLLSLTQNGTHTFLKFQRPFRTCDPQDMDITEDSMRLIYACSESVPQGLMQMTVHETVYGVKSVQILNYGRKIVPNVGNSLTLDIVTNMTVPSFHTFYACHLAKFPDFGRKVHVYMVEPIIWPGAARHVHHTLLFLCPAYYNDSMLSEPRNCYQDHHYTVLFMMCAEVLTGWAVGGNRLIIYPDEAGFSLGAPGDPMYYVLQIHYDNPTNVAGVKDYSGFRLHYTTNLRQYDAGIIWAGLMADGKHIIPPAASEYKSYGYCDLSPVSPVPGAVYPALNIFGGILHTHLLGSKVRVLQFRDGKLLRVLLEDDNYDFDLQEWRTLKEPVSVSRDDVLITECAYKSKSRTDMTTGGLSTREEMCLSFLMYYPRMDVVSCMSEVLLSELGKALNLSSTSEEDLFTTLSGWKWDESLARKLEKSVLETNQIVMVVSRTGMKYVTVKIPDIPEKQETPCVRMLYGRAPTRNGTPVALLLTALLVWLSRGEG